MNASNDWQSWAALLVVLGTVVIFVRRTFQTKKKTAGCSSCGSAPKAKVPGGKKT
jgi:hypothetical protein